MFFKYQLSTDSSIVNIFVNKLINNKYIYIYVDTTCLPCFHIVIAEYGSTLQIDYLSTWTPGSKNKLLGSTWPLSFVLHALSV